MILPKNRDPRFITIRRGGMLTDLNHHFLALWAAACAEHVLHFFESARPKDTRPHQAIEHARAWTRGEIKMMEARASGGAAMSAARPLSGAARHAAYAAGQAAVVAHVAAHDLGATARANRGQVDRNRTTSPHTILVLRPTPSKPRVRLPLKVRKKSLAGLNANGSENSYRRRFVSLFWTVSSLEMTFAGQCLTVDELDDLPQPPDKQHNKALHPTAYSSVRFGRKLPSLTALPAAGELCVLPKRAAWFKFLVLVPPLIRSSSPLMFRVGVSAAQTFLLSRKYLRVQLLRRRRFNFARTRRST